MNEITQIHLGRQAFTIASDAHKELQEYLHAIQKQVGKKGEEVVKEVENRMAELLAERGVTNEKVVLLEDVKFLKEQLGAPKDFTDKEDDESDDAEEQASEEQGQKRLFRDTDRAIIAGVAAGLAKYLKTDPVFVRIGFVLLTLFWGWGILIYIVLWLIVPEAKSSSNRLQMEGKAVTVQALKDAVHNADVPGAANRASRMIGRVLEIIGKTLLAVIGVAFLLAGCALFLATVAAGILLLTSGSQSYGEIIFPVGATEGWIVVCGMIAAGALSVLFMLMGWAMIRRKWPLAGWASVALIGVVLASASIGLGLGLDRAPDIAKRTDKLLHAEQIATAPFKKIDLTGYQTRFKFVPSDTHRVQVQYMGKQHFDAASVVKVQNETLIIDATGLLRDSDCKLFCIGEERWLEVTIYAPSLEGVVIDGLSTLTSDTPIGPNTTIAVGDGADVTLTGMHATETTVDILNDSPITTVRLTGNRAGSTAETLYIRGGTVQLTSTDVLRLNMTYECVWPVPAVHLGRMPSKVIINNNTALTSEQDLEARQTQESATFYNCVGIIPAMISY